MARARAAASWVSSGRTSLRAGRPAILSTRPRGTTSRPPSTTGGRRYLRVALQFLEPLLQPALQGVRPPARLARVEARAGLAGPLFERELRGAVVPVRDLLGETVLHGRFGLVDQREPGRADFREMFRDDVGDGVRLRRLLQTPANPGALGPFEERVDRRLVVRQRPVVEIRRVVQMARHAVVVELDVEHPLRDDAPIAGTGDADVLQVCSMEKSTRGVVPSSRSSTRTAPRLSRSRWRSRVRSMTASSNGWPGQTKAANGCPGGAISGFSNTIRS